MTYPSELIQYDAWICWRYEVPPGKTTPTKVPYNPLTGYPASTTDPSTWASHAAAVAARDHYDGLGFVLNDNAPYSMGDLDDPFKRPNGTFVTEAEAMEYADANDVWRSHWEIVRAFHTYTEWSPSRRGLRFIFKGKLPPGFGNRKGKIELYSRERFMTVTGLHIDGFPTDAEERQGTLETLAAQLGLDNRHEAIGFEDQPETRNDAALVAACFSGATGQAFARIWNGDQAGFTSGSEADLALANYICFQTDNLAQAERVFRASPYYQTRGKLHDRPELVARVIRKGFDRKAPPIDTSVLLSNMKIVGDSVNKNTPPADPLLQTLPEGMVGELAKFLYEAAPRPVREIALAGAIGFLAGVCGRAFNVNGTGLNQYVVLLTRSGRGKEAISSGVSRIMPYLTSDLQAAELFLGPSGIASAPGLLKQFATRSKSFVSLLPELGRWLKMHTDERANSTQQGLMLCFLDLWTKSGKGAVVRESVYSDKTKDIAAIEAPAFSFIGESVPHSFYSVCTPEVIESGLIPRMLIIEYEGDRMPLNEAAFSVKPQYNFISALKSLIQTALIRQNKNDPADVGYTKEAYEALKHFDTWCDFKINSAQSPVVEAIYNRSHLKALKLAALVAVCKNWMEPVIEIQHALWAIAHVKEDANKILSKFDSGDLTSGRVDDDKERAIIKVIKKYFAPDFNESPSYNIPKGYRVNGVMPVSFLRNQARKSAAFKQGKIGPSGNDMVNKTIKEMCDNGVLRTFSEKDVLADPTVIIRSEAIGILDPLRFRGD